MELDILIQNLNQKITAQGVGIERLDDKSLTAAERDFIAQHNTGKSLIIYGTLAPNKPNHSKIEHIKGKWLKGIVKGKLVNAGWGAQLGYYGFKHALIEEQVHIEAYVLFSDELVDNWAHLDVFEGAEYQRILAQFELENGEVGVGNIYALNEKKQ
jgi:gamma-glutamylcyclotransferase (GGCT)/AIG2-like uncharacterized protein YtfP